MTMLRIRPATLSDEMNCVPVDSVKMNGKRIMTRILLQTSKKNQMSFLDGKYNRNTSLP